MLSSGHRPSAVYADAQPTTICASPCRAEDNFGPGPPGTPESRAIIVKDYLPGLQGRNRTGWPRRTAWINNRVGGSPSSSIVQGREGARPTRGGPRAEMGRDLRSDDRQ